MEEPTAIRHDESYSILVDFASGVVGGCSGIIVGQPFDTVRTWPWALCGCGAMGSRTGRLMHVWLADQSPTADAQYILQRPDRLRSTDSE